MAARSNRFAGKARSSMGYRGMLQTAAKYGFKAYKYYNKYGKSKKQGSINTTTTQYDTTLQYRKKRMPRWKKRRWVKFVKKVNAVTINQLGTKTVVFNSVARGGVAPGSTDQGLLACHLYGKRGEWTFGPGNIGEAGLRDLDTIFNSAGGLANPLDNRSFMFASATMDLTAKNTGETGLEVDVYQVSYGEDLTSQSKNASQLFDRAVAETQDFESFTGLTLRNRGVTLFDLPEAIKAVKLKIWSKRKYFLPVGATFTYQYRDPKNHKIPQSRVREFNDTLEGNTTSFIYPGLTRGVFIVYKKITTETALNAELSVGCTRKYKFVVDTADRTEDGYSNSQ